MSIAYTGEVSAAGEHEELAGGGINWWGMAFFIASEALIFANLIAAYLYLEIRNGNWRPPVDYIIPIIGTVLLLGSSIPIRFAGNAISKGNQRNLKLGLTVTILMGAAFLVGLGIEYYGAVVEHNFTPSTSLQGSCFYALTGLHASHVIVGLIFLSVVLMRSLRGDFTPKKHWAVVGGEMYWHFVDTVWVFVLTVVYLLPLIR
ncbi:MAG TPA: heme-copper oxidase subunit III [Ktedonobacteraceae bacterium]|nr:heme-copper oxidase subunit III [Ktedonobacteraceae bacterium]